MKIVWRLLFPYFLVVVLFSFPALYFVLSAYPQMDSLGQKLAVQEEVYQQLLRLRDLRGVSLKNIYLLEFRREAYVYQNLMRSLKEIQQTAEGLSRLESEDGLLKFYIDEYVASEILLNQNRLRLYQSFLEPNSSVRGWAYYNSSLLLDALTEARSQDIIQYVGKGIAEISSNLESLYRFMLTLSAICVFVAVLLTVAQAYYLSKYVARPLAQVLGGLRRVSRGRFGADILAAGVRDEMSELVKSFNDMQKSVKDSKDQAEIFRAIAAHDLKEPLTTIISYTNALKEEGFFSPSEMGDIVQRIRSNALMGLEMVSELLELARSSPSNLKKEPLSFKEVVYQASQSVESRIQESGSLIEIGEVVDSFQGDPVQIETLVRNLFSNAIKFRHSQRQLKIRIWTELPKPGRVQIHVQDNAEGFDESRFSEFLKPFKGTPPPNGSERSSGLGLAVCDRIAKNHGGEITAHSRPGEGSHFVVDISAL